MSNIKMPKYKSTVRLAPRNCLEDEDERPSRSERCVFGTKGRSSCYRPTVMAHQVAAEGRVQCTDPSCLKMFTTMKHMKKHLKDRHQQTFDKRRKIWITDTKEHAEERKRGLADDRYAQRRGLTERTAHRYTGPRVTPTTPRPRVPRHPSTHSSRYDQQTTSRDIPNYNRDVRWLPTAPDNSLQEALDERQGFKSTAKRVQVSSTVTHASFGSPPAYYSRSANTEPVTREDKSNQTNLSPVLATAPRPEIFVIHGQDGSITISDDGIMRDETVKIMIDVIRENPGHNIPQNIRMFIRKLEPAQVLTAVQQSELVVGFRLLRVGLTTKLNPSDPVTPYQTFFAPKQAATQTDTEALVPSLTPLRACEEPGTKETTISHDNNASLPSDEACEKVSDAGEQL